MAEKEPIAELDGQFSSGGAPATAWAEAVGLLEEARIYWLATVRPDGRPHVTPLFAVWSEGALCFCTGEGERKAKNLRENARCTVTTGCNVVEGLDVVLEGAAARVRDEEKLGRLAGLWKAKYDWAWRVRDGAFLGEEGNV